MTNLDEVLPEELDKLYRKDAVVNSYVDMALAAGADREEVLVGLVRLLAWVKSEYEKELVQAKSMQWVVFNSDKEGTEHE